MKQEHAKNMTTGSPLKLILSFSLPLLLGNIFQQTYNMVDTAIVGQTLGAKALAAVGASTADYAIAMVDEIESGDHIQERISVVRA